MRGLKLLAGIVTIGYLAFSVANGIVSNDYRSIQLLVAGAGVLVLFYKPHFMFILGYVVISRFFVNYFFHIPGLLKSFDVGFILCMVSGALIWRRHLYMRTDIFKGAFSVVVVVFVAYLCFEVIQTVYVQQQSIKLTIQAGRFYYYILIYFAAVPFLLTFERWPLLLKWLGGIAILGAILYCVQKIFNFGFLAPFYRVVGRNRIGAVRISRMKAAIVGPGSITAAILLLYLLSDRIKRNAGRVWVYFSFLVLQPLLSFARGYILSVFAMLMTAVMLAPVALAKKNKIIVFSALGLLILTAGASFFRWGDVTLFPQLFYKRIASAGTDYLAKSGTYQIRYSMREERMRVIRDNPILGVGFIHDESGLYSDITGGIGSGHDGYISLWGQLGFLGFGVFILFSIVTALEARHISRLPLSFLYRAVAIVYISYMVWGYINMVSTDAFILERSFTTIGIMMALMQTARYRFARGQIAQEELLV